MEQMRNWLSSCLALSESRFVEASSQAFWVTHVDTLSTAHTCSFDVDNIGASAVIRALKGLS